MLLKMETTSRKLLKGNFRDVLRYGVVMVMLPLRSNRGAVCHPQLLDDVDGDLLHTTVPATCASVPYRWPCMALIGQGRADRIRFIGFLTRFFVMIGHPRGDVPVLKKKRKEKVQFAISLAF